MRRLPKHCLIKYPCGCETMFLDDKEDAKLEMNRLCKEHDMQLWRKNFKYDLIRNYDVTGILDKIVWMGAGH